MTISAQKILRVNNDQNVTGVNVYRSAQAAHDAAQGGDILVLEPSNIDYGVLILSKPLKIYGNGYFLDTNTELRIDDRSSRLQELHFNTGSDGSEVYGLEIISNDSEVTICGVSNIRIERCLLSAIDIDTENLEGTTTSDVSNITIARNFLENIRANQIYSESYHPISHVLVTNNIFSELSGGEGDLYAADAYGWAVINNTFIGTAGGEIFLSNALFENNVCFEMGDGLGLVLKNVASNFNISSGNDINGGIGNQNNVVFTDVFVSNGSADEKWKIKETSSLKTAGQGGTEVGAFGGADPYVVSGIGLLPSVTELIIEGDGSNDIPVQVKISATSNH